jgi:cell division protein FtsZ
MGDMVAPHAGIHQAFSKADTTISQSIRSIVNLIQRPGLIRIGFDDLVAALRSRNGRCLFGFGESDSENRAHDALAQALKSPLMDRGRTLGEAARVLVQVAGGPGMTLSEVEIVMKELDRHVSDETQILFGTAVDGRLGDRLSVTIISSFAANDNVVPQQAQTPPLSSAPPMPPAWEQAHASPPKIEVEPEAAPIEDFQSPETTPIEEPEPIEAEDVPAPSVESVSSAFEVVDTPEPLEPPVATPRGKSTPVKEEKVSAEKTLQAKQEVLQFEPVNRGRFEKSEPTIVEGEDLDVPTYLRKKIKMK